jgi:hypothetical protein
MFAPPVAKAQTKVAASSTNTPAHRRSTLVAQRLRDGAVEQAHMLQPTLGKQAALRLLPQRASGLTGNELDDHEREVDRMSMPIREAVPGVSWDFNKIPVLAPDRANRRLAGSPLAAPPLPGAIQPKQIVGQVNDPLALVADHIAEQVIRAPDAPDRSRGLSRRLAGSASTATWRRAWHSTTSRGAT